VYRAEELRGYNNYAIKAFSKSDLNLDGRGTKALKNEINILKEIDSPYVSRLVEVHETFNSVYMVMELLEGGELFHFLKEKKSVNSSEVYIIMSCLLKALVCLERSGIVHRDIKLKNLVISEKKDLKESSIKLGKSFIFILIYLFAL
jgi:serine/threonine protein kinase